MNQMDEDTENPPSQARSGTSTDEIGVDNQILEAVNAGNVSIVQEWTNRVGNLPDGRDRLTKAFLSCAYDAPDASLKAIWDSGLVDIRQPDDINRRNILHKAAISGRTELLRIGLEGGADVRAVDVYLRVPLHYASMHGYTSMIDALVQAAPNTINVKDIDKFSPLVHAIVHAQLECVHKLLEYGAAIDPASETDHIPLNLACQHGSLPIVALLLRKKPQILPDAEGLYPQHLVARSARNVRLLHLLREYGADLDQPDKLYQWTPLFHASSEGNVEYLRALLDSDVNHRILDEKGFSAMYYATWEGHIECMHLLATRGVGRGNSISAPITTGSTSRTPSITSSTRLVPSSATPIALQADASNIPEITLPPPILPVRRYGHNYLDNKTFISIKFGNLDYLPIEFYNNTKYPASRLTVSSKSSDLIPRNLLLPIQDESTVISFQIDNIDSFSIDFDIYPTFGSRIIGRAVASSRIFTQPHRSRPGSPSSGTCDLELFDPRLRVIGHISFKFTVVKPFPGTPLEITHFATYWRATSRLDSLSESSASNAGSSSSTAGPTATTLITGSSLSGEYVRLFCQTTSDGVPVLWPRWTVDHEGLHVPISSLSHADFDMIGRRRRGGQDVSLVLQQLLNATQEDIPRVHQVLAEAFVTLRQALRMLPTSLNVEVHVLFPNEREGGRTGGASVNDVVDSLLAVVFEHARTLRGGAVGAVGTVGGVNGAGGGVASGTGGVGVGVSAGVGLSGVGGVRGVVFSSFNPDVCTAINWKQPNCEFFLLLFFGSIWLFFAIMVCLPVFLFFGQFWFLR